MTRPYPAKRKYSRATVLYGISVHGPSGRHVCFNRDYGQLPVELPAYVVEQIKENAEALEKNRFFAPHALEGLFGDTSAEEWTTYFLFSDATAPAWEVD